MANHVVEPTTRGTLNSLADKNQREIFLKFFLCGKKKRMKETPKLTRC